MTIERAYRQCCYCRRNLGYTRKEYCGPACRQAHYRYRKRGMKDPRSYTRRKAPPAGTAS